MGWGGGGGVLKRKCFFVMGGRGRGCVVIGMMDVVD